jgi:glycerophosphoryl diester phosphodiesterase
MQGERRAPDWLTATTYAHRGLHGPGVPENSLAAARAAMARGLGVECDIQRSLDDYPMVFHDWDLERLTGRGGLTEALVADELERLPLLGTDQAPVRLATLLAEIGGRVPLLIEIKSQPDYDVERTCVTVARLLERYRGPAAAMSFDPRVPEWFAEQAPGICRGLVGTDSLPNGYERVWRDPQAIERASPDFLALDRRDLGCAQASAWRQQGGRLLTWTIRTSTEAAEARAHADALIAEGEALA